MKRRGTRMRTTASSLFAAFLVAASVWGQAAPPAKSPAHKATTTSTAPRPSLLNPASLNRKASDVFKAKFTTTKSPFVVVNFALNTSDAFRFSEAGLSNDGLGAVQFGIPAR